MRGWPYACATPALADPHVLSRRARAALARPDEPVRVLDACRLAGAQLRVDRIALGEREHEAMILPSGLGFTIVVNPALRARAMTQVGARRRTRFAIAHELGHTFFYSRDAATPRREHRPNRVEERFCHVFATGLLVPPQVADDVELTPHGLHVLAGRYDAPLATVAWTAVRRRGDLSIVSLRWAPHPRTGDREALRVEWAASTRFFARGESFKSKLAGLAPGEHALQEEHLRLGGRSERVHLSAWRRRSDMLLIVHHEPSAPTAPASSESAQLTLL